MLPVVSALFAYFPALLCCPGYGSVCEQVVSENACETRIESIVAAARSSRPAQRAIASDRFSGFMRRYGTAKKNIRVVRVVACERISLDAGVFMNVNAGEYQYCEVEQVADADCKQHVRSEPMVAEHLLWAYSESGHTTVPIPGKDLLVLQAHVNLGRVGEPDVVTTSILGNPCE